MLTPKPKVLKVLKKV